MEALIKIFIVFWAVWIIWYVTGGPLRDDKSRPYIGLTEYGTLETFSTTTTPR